CSSGSRVSGCPPLEAHEPPGTVGAIHFGRRADHTAFTSGWRWTASDAGESFDRPPSTTRLQHFDRSHLVRAGQSFFVDRSEAPKKAGSTFRGFATYRCRVDQPQSL